MVILCAWWFTQRAMNTVTAAITAQGTHTVGVHLNWWNIFFSVCFFRRSDLLSCSRNENRYGVMCIGWAEVPTRPFVNWISWMLMVLLRVRVLKKKHTHRHTFESLFEHFWFSETISSLKLNSFTFLFVFSSCSRIYFVHWRCSRFRNSLVEKKIQKMGRVKFQFRLTHSWTPTETSSCNLLFSFTEIVYSINIHSSQRRAAGVYKISWH